jgi:hypothetical protein
MLGDFSGYVSRNELSRYIEEPEAVHRIVGNDKNSSVIINTPVSIELAVKANGAKWASLSIDANSGDAWLQRKSQPKEKIMTKVFHDDTLNGNGTEQQPLRLAPNSNCGDGFSEAIRNLADVLEVTPAIEAVEAKPAIPAVCGCHGGMMEVVAKPAVPAQIVIKGDLTVSNMYSAMECEEFFLKNSLNKTLAVNEKGKLGISPSIFRVGMQIEPTKMIKAADDTSLLTVGMERQGKMKENLLNQYFGLNMQFKGDNTDKVALVNAFKIYCTWSLNGVVKTGGPHLDANSVTLTETHINVNVPISEFGTAFPIEAVTGLHSKIALLIRVPNACDYGDITWTIHPSEHTTQAKYLLGFNLMTDAKIRNLNFEPNIVAPSLTLSGQTISNWNEIQYLTEQSHTVTHITDVENFDQEQVGAFCETNGGIYSGYNRIAPTDCICQVIRSKQLNRKIVGIIVSEDKFASHGDALVKVGAGTFRVGDLLVPKGDGTARVATEDDKWQVAINGIPRVKITALATGIPHMVACFLS